MKKLVIIPAYNESASIKKTIEEIKEKAPDFDYVIINDCSTDNTKKICEENHYNVINLPINLGIGGAVQTGYRYGYNEGYDYEQGYGSCDFVFDVHLFNCNFCEYFNKEEK